MGGRRLTVDLGTGDGAAVLRAARRSPGCAVLGIDADATRMREASARAARSPEKGGIPNAWFVVAAAEALPEELEGRVDTLCVTLPWGSLLRGVLGPEAWFSDAASRLLRPGGALRLLVSATPRDRVPGVPILDSSALDALVGRYQAAGWCVHEARDATLEDVATSGSSWAKRLGIPGRRAATFLRLVPRRDQPSSSAA